MNFTSFRYWLNEEFKSNSVWRMTDQRWLKYLLDQDQELDVEKYYNQLNPKDDHSHRFISLSFDSNSGGQDHFGGKEIIIEFDEKMIFKQGAIEIEYYPEWMEENPKICRYVTGYKNEQDYYEQHDYANAEEANANFDLTWEEYLEDYKTEQEIVMKKIKYVPGLIKNVIFFVKPEEILIEMLKENDINYEIQKL